MMRLIARWTGAMTSLVLVVLVALLVPMAVADPDDSDRSNPAHLGPRPWFLLADMDPGPLKDRLQQCADRHRFSRSDFSIAHRGAPLQFPEHTRESYTAAALMGAGVMECDVTFTRDRQLVCRHAQCDLHTTTNILLSPLAEKCSEPFTPAHTDKGIPARARCCTSDISLAEFRTLQGKMDALDPQATTVQQFVRGTADWRTTLYASRGTLMTHRESIELFRELGVKFTPELKSPEVTMPFQGEYSQRDYAQQLIDDYKAAGVAPAHVRPQSFDLDDILYWIRSEPEFGDQAVFLDGRYRDRSFDPGKPASWQPGMKELRAQGVRVIAPPLWVLLTLDENQRIVPSVYARHARAAGLKIITWTLERSGPLGDGGGWYYQSVGDAIDNDGDVFEVLDVLARDVGVFGVFSDWPATVTYYANCMDKELKARSAADR